MSRFYFRLAILPLIIFAAVLLLIHTQPYDDHEAHSIQLLDDCPAPCFIGIRPGLTTIDQAMIILSRSKWVSDVHWDGVVDTKNDRMTKKGGTIFWNWSNQKPSWINDTSLGQITVEGYVVRTITIYSKIHGFF